MRDLLTHTSGFGYGNGVGGDLWTAAGQTGYYFADKDETIRDSVRRIASLPAHAQPGTHVDLRLQHRHLGRARRSRRRQAARPGPARAHLRAARHARHGVLSVAGQGESPDGRVLAATTASSSARPPPGNAVGQGHYVDGPRKNFSGGAGLLSTATDYARFLQMMLNGGTLDGRRILSRKTVELMTTSHLGDIAYNAGPGFRPRLLRRRRRRRARLAGLRQASSAGAARTTRRTGSIRARSSSSCT